MAQKVEKVSDAKPDDLNLLPETPSWKETVGSHKLSSEFTHMPCVNTCKYCCPVDIRSIFLKNYKSIILHGKYKEEKTVRLSPGRVMTE